MASSSCWGGVKINFDGWVQELQRSTRFVIRDSEGHVLLAGAKKIGESTITIAEGIALRDDLVHALDHGWRNLIEEGDSKLIIDCVLRKVSIPWRVAYALARLGHGMTSSCIWEHGLPLLVVSPFYFDLFGLSWSQRRNFLLSIKNGYLKQAHFYQRDLAQWKKTLTFKQEATIR